MNNRFFKLVFAASFALIIFNGLLLYFADRAVMAKAADGYHTVDQPARRPAAFPVLTTTVQDFFLPGSQPGHLTEPIAIPGTCDNCHTDPIYNRWRGSMMSQASRDPLMWAALAVANKDAPQAGEYCLRCHSPKGWLEGASQPADGSALPAAALEAGVACEICHRLVDPVPSASDQAAAVDAAIRGQLALSNTLPPTGHQASAMMIVDPVDNRRGPFVINPNPHPNATYQTDLMNQSGNAATRSRLCGACHNVDNPALSWNDNPPNGAPPQYWPNDFNQAAPSFDKGDLFPIERTFEEWRNSQYVTGVYAPQFAGAKPDGIVSACPDCHMPRQTGKAAEQSSAVLRNCQTNGCLPEHELVGGNTWVPRLLQDSRWRLHSGADTAHLNVTVGRARAMLQRAAGLSVTLTYIGANKIALVRVTNETGHKLPTGYPEGRRMWLNLRAYRGTKLVYESGAYNPATGVLAQDPVAKIYEAKFGLTPELAAATGLPAGESFHFVLNNTVIKDNRIPPRGYTVAAFNQPGLRPVGAVYQDGQYWDETIYMLPGGVTRVEARLYYQTASKEYIDFLRANGEADGISLGQLWDTLKSPPELMAQAVSQTDIYLPIIIK